mmetsp:Transcript_31515/g.76352  ORF Transcript_31515/g.76352 Transcript_31515/m.76352 type:complete len:248 (-) Transcript_31515:367-1110(-)
MRWNDSVCKLILRNNRWIPPEPILPLVVLFLMPSSLPSATVRSDNWSNTSVNLLIGLFDLRLEMSCVLTIRKESKCFMVCFSFCPFPCGDELEGVVTEVVVVQSSSTKRPSLSTSWFSSVDNEIQNTPRSEITDGYGKTSSSNDRNDEDDDDEEDEDKLGVDWWEMVVVVEVGVNVEEATSSFSLLQHLLPFSVSIDVSLLLLSTTIMASTFSCSFSAMQGSIFFFFVVVVGSDCRFLRPLSIAIYF